MILPGRAGILIERVHLFLGGEIGNIHLVAHCFREDIRHALAHNYLSVITREYLVMSVYVKPDVGIPSDIPEISWGLPRQCAHWLAMTWVYITDAY